MFACVPKCVVCVFDLFTCCYFVLILAGLLRLFCLVTLFCVCWVLFCTAVRLGVVLV